MIYRLAMCFCFLSACGYHVAGHADLLPRSIQTIAIPPFGNNTTRYKLTDRLPSDITREFISRSRYKVVSDTNSADAILQGAVLNYYAYPTIFDPGSGRASGVQMLVRLQVSLVERKTGAVLFTRPSIEMKQRYEISIDPKAYFEESEAGLQRLSRDVARSVVSAILENF